MTRWKRWPLGHRKDCPEKLGLQPRLAGRLFLAFLILLLPALAQTPATPVAATAPAAVPPNPSIAALGVRPEVLPWDDGQAGLNLLFKKLKNTGRIMHLTAHPDDEDGPLLTYLARGQGRQVLLMSLTRGEGGQNRTGSNLWDELGVLRTLELLESTRYYGAELRFSRVADFGYSKSADETFKKWGGHEVPLRDIVYVIREWKPDVLFTRFSGTPRDGHGHHQASAILAPEAVKCAVDPKCFPDQLRGPNALTTWQVLKLYMGNQGPNADYTVRYDVSQIDPDTKMTYAQMALEGFKHQASQLSGDFKYPSGPNWRSYKLVYSALPKQPAPGEHEQDFFDGIDTTVAGLTSRIGSDDAKVYWLKSELAAFSSFASDIKIGRGDALARAYEQGMSTLVRLQKADISAAQKTFLGQRVLFFASQLQRNAEAAFGVKVEVFSDHDRPAVRGESVKLQLHTRNENSTNVQVDRFVGGWRRPGTGAFQREEPLNKDERAFLRKTGTEETLRVPDWQPFARQHWHRDDAERDTTYKVDDERLATVPILHAPAVGTANLLMAGQQLPYVKTASLSGTEKFVPLEVSPEISLTFDQITKVVPAANSQFPVRLKVRSTSGKTRTVDVELKSKDGWAIEPTKETVTLDGTTKEGVAAFTVRYPVGAGRQTKLNAIATAGGISFSEGFSTVTRNDLDTFYYYQPAIQRVSIVDVNVPKNLRVGYIPGAGDDIFPVLQQLGLNAKQISNDELAKGDLHQYDTIIVGIRGYDERKEIRDNNQRLLDFVKDGGTLIVQNQKAEDVFNSGKFTPYPATLGRDRVSVEESPVQVLAPNDPIFNSPNKITPADFDGWVQERGINFMSQWDDHFEPLLASSDPGEQPLKGGLLRAKYGKGTYIYTGYAFFRQLPAGVPGAVRLYVNLLNAGHETK